MAIFDITASMDLWTTEMVMKPHTIRYITNLTPEVLKWMSKNVVRHQMMFDGRTIKIYIPDTNKAMLFKLTWM